MPSTRSPTKEPVGSPGKNKDSIMNIGILGAGAIGKTLIQRLSAAGNQVRFANWRGPETIADDVPLSGRRITALRKLIRVMDAGLLGADQAAFSSAAMARDLSSAAWRWSGPTAMPSAMMNSGVIPMKPNAVLR